MSKFRCFDTLSFDNKALPNEDLEFSYTIESQVVPELPDYSVNPEPGIVDSLSEISINWNEDQLNINESWEYEISFTDASGNSYISHIPELRFEGEQEEGSLGNVLVIKIDPEITDPGEYTLRIPEGFLFVNDPQTGTLPSQEIILVYVIEESGVGILINSDANGMFNIYDMQGHLLKSTKEFTDIRELAPGYYIINGKKVVVK